MSAYKSTLPRGDKVTDNILQAVQTTRGILKQFCDCFAKAYGGEEVIDELMTRRNYSSDKMRTLLLSKGIFKMPTLHEVQLTARANGMLLTPPVLRQLGLVSDSGDYFLEDRYAIPLCDWTGAPIALVCWYPDARKYITTTTYGFTATTTFFNMQSYPKAVQPDGSTVIFVVEGIFDALSVESLGYCCLGNQGLDMSPIKKTMLQRFDRVLFIPDNDRPGRMSNPYLTIRSSHHWELPNSRMIALTGKIKDMDDLIKYLQLDNLDFMTQFTSRMLKVTT